MEGNDNHVPIKEWMIELAVSFAALNSTLNRKSIVYI